MPVEPPEHRDQRRGMSEAIMTIAEATEMLSVRIALNRPRCAQLFPESRTPAALLRPAPLRHRATVRDPRPRLPHNQRPLRAAPTQSRLSPKNSELGRGPRRRKKKRHRRGMRVVLENRLRTAETPNLAAQRQSVSRKTVEEVPLTGLSFSAHHQCPHAAISASADPRCRGQEPSLRTLARMGCGPSMSQRHFIFNRIR